MLSLSRGNGVARITTRICKGPHPRLCAQFRLPFRAPFTSRSDVARITTRICKGPHPRLCAQHSYWLTTDRVLREKNTHQQPLASPSQQQQCCTDNDTDMQWAIPETLCSASADWTGRQNNVARITTRNAKSRPRLCAQFRIQFVSPKIPVLAKRVDSKIDR